MPEQNLNDPNVGSALQQMRREAMAQRVHRDPFCQTRRFDRRSAGRVEPRRIDRTLSAASGKEVRLRPRPFPVGAQDGEQRRRASRCDLSRLCRREPGSGRAAVGIRQSQANDAINELNALARSELVDKEVTVRVHLAGGCRTFAGIGFDCNKSC
jgi:hypothetical protein